MKNRILKIAFAASLSLFAGGAFAQQDFGEKWGGTPAEQQENVLRYNYLRDAYNNQQYDEALRYLSGLMKKAPKGTVNIFIMGGELYKNQILKATSLADKNAYIDSLMLLYDKRLENYGDDPKMGKAYILANKATDYLQFKPADREGISQYFREAIEASGDNIDLVLVIRYFNELTEDYRADLIESDKYLDEYDRLETIVKSPEYADQTELINSFEALFIRSGAANCENIEKMFKEHIAANPTDKELLQKAITLLGRGNCEGDFYMDVAMKLHAVEPSYSTAIFIATALEQKGEYARAIEYLTHALTAENDAQAKAALNIRMAASYLGLNNGRSAADHAKQAAALDPQNGLAFYMLGQAYTLGASQCKDFDRQTVYWLVYDTLAKAKQLGADAQISSLDQNLANVRANFPPELECFMRNLEEGQSYTVSCGWVSGTTVVRAN